MNEFEVYEVEGVYWGIRGIDEGLELKLPNGVPIWFVDKESAEKVCELLNNKIMFVNC